MMLGDITIGRYIPAQSPIHSMDARSKILASIIFAAAVFTCSSPVSLMILGAVTLLALIISKIPLKYTLKGLKPLRWFILFTMIVNLFAAEGRALWEWSVFHITDTGIITAAEVAFKFVLFVAGTSLLTLSTPPIALTDGIARLIKPLKLLRVPTDDIATIISATLRFIPTFADEAEKIMKAQSARGADFGGHGLIAKVRAVIPVTIPLFVSSLRKADELALAMDSRCYGKGTRNPRNKSRFGKSDLSLMIIFIILCGILALIEFLH